MTEEEAWMSDSDDPLFPDDDDHCGNDCGGYRDEDSGDWEDSDDCVHCECCCTCTSCEYARVA